MTDSNVDLHLRVKMVHQVFSASSLVFILYIVHLMHPLAFVQEANHTGAFSVREGGS